MSRSRGLRRPNGVRMTAGTLRAGSLLWAVLAVTALLPVQCTDGILREEPFITRGRLLASTGCVLLLLPLSAEAADYNTLKRPPARSSCQRACVRC